jgi:hypothetical protein
MKKELRELRIVPLLHWIGNGHRRKELLNPFFSSLISGCLGCSA